MLDAAIGIDREALCLGFSAGLRNRRGRGRALGGGGRRNGPQPTWRAVLRGGPRAVGLGGDRHRRVWGVRGRAVGGKEIPGLPRGGCPRPPPCSRATGPGHVVKKAGGATAYSCVQKPPRNRLTQVR